MCRFNLILTCGEQAIRILERNEYQKMFENVNHYPAYQKGYCNCGSCVGGLIDKKGRSFKEAIAETKKERLERLYQIKEFMDQPGYEERKEIYNQKIEDLFQVMIHCQQEDTEMSPEYEASIQKLQKYQLENELMGESICYFRTEEEEEESKVNTRGIPLNQMIDLPEELILENMKEDAITENVIEVMPEPESYVIDSVISRTEKNNYNNYRDEFAEYVSLFHELLNEVPDIIFATIWSEPENMKLVKTVTLDSLRIEDLVYLNYNEMIRIHGKNI